MKTLRLLWSDAAVCFGWCAQLDAGVPEKVLLLSRDEQNMMVCSYADLKACAERSFDQVQGAAAARGQP